MQYYSGKINMVLDALSWKSMAMFLTQQKDLLEEIIQLDLEIVLLGSMAKMKTLQFQPPLVKATQKDDPKLQKFWRHVEVQQRIDLCQMVLFILVVGFICIKEKFDRNYF